MADKPDYTPDQIENELFINWGGSDQGVERNWTTDNLTYELGDASTFNDGATTEDAGYSAMSATLDSFAQAAFAEWSQLADLTFTEVTGDPTQADITLAYSSTTVKDGTYTIPTLGNSQDVNEITHQAVWLSSDAKTWYDQQSANISYTNYGFITMLHEIGHALGLSHPGPYNASNTNPPDYADNAVFEQDNRQNTIMSYFGYETQNGWTQDGTASGDLNPGGDIVLYPSTPMVYDVLAIQAKYGANMSTRDGDTTYGFNSNAGEDYYDFSKTPQVVFTIWDGGGHDTLDASFTDPSFVQSIDLHAGAYSSVGGLINNIGIAFGVTIEDAIGGAGEDTIVGNDADNHLSGNGGNDILLGEGGADILDGGAGDDQLDGGGGGHDVLTGGAGDDTFIYKTGYGGTEITDFSQDVDGNSDGLDLTKAAVHSLEDLQADGSQQGANTVFSFGGGDMLTLDNFQLDTLTPDQIEFSEPTQVVPGNFLLAANPDAASNRNSQLIMLTAPLSNDDFIGVWIDPETDSDESPMVAHVYDSHGVATGVTFDINTTPLVPLTVGAGGLGGGSPNLQLVTLANGEFVAVWNANALDQSPSNPDGFRQIRYRVFAADGTPLGPDQIAETTPAVLQTDGRWSFSLFGVQATADGGFSIQWTNRVGTVDTGQDFHLYTRSFAADGTPDGNDTDLGAYGDLYNAGLYHGTEPNDVYTVNLSSGEVLSYWQAADSTGAVHAYAQIDGITGVVQLDQNWGYNPNNFDRTTQPNISVSELSDGDILFTWGASDNSGVASVIFDSNLQGFIQQGTSGDDVLKGSIYDDQLYGLAGDDTLQGGPGADLLDGGPGNDTVDYSDSLEVVVNNQLAGVDIDLTRTGPQHDGYAEGDTLVSIENIIGSSYDDQLVGDAGVNVIKGGFGRDHIDGNGGADQLYGGAGDDVITLRGDGGMVSGDAGDDFITVLGNNTNAHGGDGNDAIYVTGDGSTLTGDAGDDILEVMSGNGNALYGGAGNDTLTIVSGNDDTLNGGPGEDTLTLLNGSGNLLILGDDGGTIQSAGSGSGNILEGGAGSDTISAAENTGTGETLRGGDGNDILIGGAGNDILEGDGGNDDLTGGAGIDTAVFSGNISDYLISLVPLDPTKPLGPNNEGFSIEDNRPNSDGTDLVSNDVEKFQFANGTFDAAYLETASKAGDGYITGATVFADANGNGVLDSDEVSTTTDAGGGFTMPSGASGPLVLSGGTDVGTGLAFRGEFLAPAGYNFISPLTTIAELLTKDGLSNPEQTVLTNLGLDPATNLATEDPIVEVDTFVDSAPEKVSVQIANTVDLIASAIEGTHPGEFSTAYADAFQALATAIGNGSFSFNDAVSDPTGAVSEVTHVIDATLSAGGFTLDPAVANGTAQIITAFNADGAIDFSGDYGLAGMETVAKLAQGAAADAVEDAGADPSTISNAVDDFTGSALDDAVNAQFGLSGDIDGPYINNPPATNPDSYTVKSNTELTVDAAHGVLANDIDYDGDPLTAVSDGQPAHGTVVLNADGSFTYTPDKDFAGVDTFNYEADDGTTTTLEGVSIEVDGPHPVVTNITAVPSSGVLHEGDSFTVTVTMSSAVDVDQTNAPLELFTNDFPLVLESGAGTDSLVFTGTLGDYTLGTPLEITGDDNDDFDAHVTDALTGSLADLSGAHVTFQDLSVACYCPGTLIVTESGECAVEDLAIGDCLITPSGLRPIKWIGKRSYGGRFILGRKDLLPICFKADSLGEGLPRRDLWISPHHAMYLDGVLIEARDLVNGVSIVQAERVEKVEYFHIELDSHDVILAEGALSETFIDDDSRGMFHNAHEYGALYPDAERVAARYCAKRCADGYEVEAARRRIDARAGLRPAGGEAATALRGYVETVSAGRISGWAQNPEYPEAPVCLDIFAGGRLIGQTLANGYREDLKQAGIGSGNHSFGFELPHRVAFTDVTVRRSFDGTLLPALAGAAAQVSQTTKAAYSCGIGPARSSAFASSPARSFLNGRPQRQFA
jgi:Ca2+-binding RTX toxin-like protein